jgi:predicted nucleic acid-binding protein
VRVFLDTNILLDIVEQRANFAAASQQVLDRCDVLHFDVSVAAHGLATVFYLTRRKVGNSTATEVIRQILSWAEAAPLGDAEARTALGLGIADYEDALQASAAAASGAKWIITRDTSGFAGSRIPVLSPEQFLERFPAPATI